MIGLEAMLRLFPEEERNDKAFLALTRFLDALDETPLREGARAVHEPIGLSFQLKLLWVSGLLPHLTRVRRVRRTRRARRLRAGSRAARSAPTATPTGSGSRREGISGIEALLTTPIADAATLELTRPGAPRRAGGRLRVVRAPRRLQAAHRLDRRSWRGLAQKEALDRLTGDDAREATAARSRSTAPPRARTRRQ